MSQEKVDKYKQEKYNRKHAKKKTNVKKILAYVITTLIACVFVFWIGRSVLYDTGILETKVTYPVYNDEQMESLKQQWQEQHTTAAETTTESGESTTENASTTEAASDDSTK